MIDGVSRERQSDSPYSVGYGYIAIPSGVDRDNYIDTCFRRERVTVITDLGGVFNDCYITSDALQRISFPSNIEEKGSCVCFISCTFNNKPIVVGVLQGDNSSSMLKENMYQVRKVMGDSEVLIQANPKDNSLVINLTSSKAGKVFLKCVGSEENELNIVSSGSVNVSADKSINATSYKEASVQIKDVENKNDVYQIYFDKEKALLTRKCQSTKEDTTIVLDQNGVDIKTEGGNKEIKIDLENILLKTDKKVNINNGGQSMVKAEDLILRIDQLQTQISQIVQAFATGAAAAVNMDGGRTAMTTAYGSLSGIVKIDFNPIKSKIGFLD